MKIFLFYSMGNSKLRSWNRLKPFSPAGGRQTRPHFRPDSRRKAVSKTIFQCFVSTPKLLIPELSFVCTTAGMGQDPLIRLKHCSCPNRKRYGRGLLELLPLTPHVTHHNRRQTVLYTEVTGTAAVGSLATGRRYSHLIQHFPPQFCSKTDLPAACCQPALEKGAAPA